MALSANTDWVVKPVFVLRPISCIVLNAAVIYKGALVTHDTTAGEVKPFDGTEADRFVGWAMDGPVTGNSSGARNRVSVLPGGFMVLLTVAGVANDATDYGALVYASDDGTYTLSATGNKLIGKGVPDDKRASGQLNVFTFPIIDGVNDSAAT